MGADADAATAPAASCDKPNHDHDHDHDHDHNDNAVENKHATSAGDSTTDRYGFAPPAYDFSRLPDGANDFVAETDITEFARALAAPENSGYGAGGGTAGRPRSSSLFITALNDWRPVHQRVRSRGGGPKKTTTTTRRPPRRGKDETREGFVYGVLKWPLLIFVMGWLAVLSAMYALTRVYIFLYEHYFTWRGNRERLRRALKRQTTYEGWVQAAKELDEYLGGDKWKKEDEYAYYDSRTVRRVRDQMEKLRKAAEKEEGRSVGQKEEGKPRAIDELRGLVEACVKNNFVGTENPRLYSETYYGTKDLVQAYVDEVEASLSLLLRTERIDQDSKRALFKHLATNYGRTALCLSGGATFAYYHFGVAKALLDADLLPDVITGTSGGALVAALVATRTNEELKKLLIPALAHRITACHDDVATWLKRWYRTGARFDSLDWARRLQWFTRGSMTFREAYTRTGRILNVTCVPSDPHSPTILTNYLTSPDCVIWSAVLASAAVPGILNPVVLMKKTPEGVLEPYSFGHKWKDGSLRTDIPLKALNLHFNVNFSIVSQVNPHINLFFFSSRGSVGRPVTHRRGRGWRGGFLGSATEQYLKLDLTKWLKVLRHLELLPRPLGQDWSEIWLQRFNGTITLWPKSIPSDFYYILSDPSPDRLARMIHVGQQSTFPKLKFIANRARIERLIAQGRRATRPARQPGELRAVLSDEDLQGLGLDMRERGVDGRNGLVAPFPPAGLNDGVADDDAYESSDEEDAEQQAPARPSLQQATGKKPARFRIVPPGRDKGGRKKEKRAAQPDSPSFSQRISDWWAGLGSP
ncbi:acyl transferase/acyl hydrolase/lysophospholipase, partial [Lineolata rhizophorae]